jgi:tRNA pseudouridine38-40 synthase
MPRYKITIEYDGTSFAGWQKQNRVTTVQGLLETALSKIADHPVAIICAGRTDSGVHAIAQVIHVDFAKPRTASQIMQGVNTHILPHRIVVVAVKEVADDFHARFSAKQRHYRYQICSRDARLALDETRAWHLFQTLDIEAMRHAAKDFIGTHDLSSFRASECQANSPVKTINRIDISTEDDFIMIRVCAPSFMHNQVRIMVGTLAEIAIGKRDKNSIPQIIKAKNRIAAGITAPACGLYFTKVDY